MFIKKIGSLVLILMLMSVPPACADRIFLKTGEIVSGDILYARDDEIKIDTGVGIPLTYFNDQIDRIDTRDFEINMRESLSDEEMTQNIVQLIQESQRHSRNKKELKSWDKNYRWYTKESGQVVIEYKYSNKQSIAQSSGQGSSATVKVYYKADDLK